MGTGKVTDTSNGYGIRPCCKAWGLLCRIVRVRFLGVLLFLATGFVCHAVNDCPEIVRKASLPRRLMASAAGYFKEFKSSQVGLKRLLMYPDKSGVEFPFPFPFPFIAQHDSDQTMVWFEKPLHLNIRGKKYTIRPIDGIYQKAISPLTREHGRKGTEFAPSMISKTIILSSLGIFSALEYGLQIGTKETIKAMDKTSDETVERYFREHYLFKPFRDQNLSLDDPEVRLKALRLIAEIRSPPQINLSDVTEQDVEALRKKLTGLVGENLEQGYHQMLILLAVTKVEGEPKLSKKEKRIVQALSLTSSLETFKPTFLFLSLPLEDQSTDSFRLVSNADSKFTKTENGNLDALSTNGFLLAFAASKNHLDHLSKLNQVDHITKSREQVRSSQTYKEHAAEDQKFNEWATSPSTSAESVAYYLSAQRQVAESYRLYEQSGVSAELSRLAPHTAGELQLGKP
jgi:hypothetical protein